MPCAGYGQQQWPFDARWGCDYSCDAVITCWASSLGQIEVYQYWNDICSLSIFPCHLIFYLVCYLFPLHCSQRGFSSQHLESVVICLSQRSRDCSLLWLCPHLANQGQQVSITAFWESCLPPQLLTIMVTFLSLRK